MAGLRYAICPFAKKWGAYAGIPMAVHGVGKTAQPDHLAPRCLQLPHLQRVGQSLHQGAPEMDPFRQHPFAEFQVHQSPASFPGFINQTA